MLKLKLLIMLAVLTVLTSSCMGPYFGRGHGWRENCSEENQEDCRPYRRGYHCWE